MPVYTIHEPPLRKRESAVDPDRIVFVRDGFTFWAFALPPLWMLLHRLWLVLVLYIGLNVIVAAALFAAGVSGGMRLLVAALIGLLVGFEAATLRRWTYERRGWRPLGVVVGEDRYTAERRFFASWLAREGEPPAAPALTPVNPARRSVASDVIGLFPEPGAPR